MSFSTVLLAALVVLSSVQFAQEQVASIVVFCDDSGVLERYECPSDFASCLVTSLGTNGGNYYTPIRATVDNITPYTSVRCTCDGQGVVDGFIGQVTYFGEVYSTADPLGDGAWSAYDGASGIGAPIDASDLQFWPRQPSDPSAWASAISNYGSDIDSNANWVWDGQIGNTISFWLFFANIYESSKPTDNPSPAPTSFPTPPPSPAPTPAPTPSPTGSPGSIINVDSGETGVTDKPTAGLVWQRFRVETVTQSTVGSAEQVDKGEANFIVWCVPFAMIGFIAVGVLLFMSRGGAAAVSPDAKEAALVSEEGV